MEQASPASRLQGSGAPDLPVVDGSMALRIDEHDRPQTTPSLSVVADTVDVHPVADDLTIDLREGAAPSDAPRIVGPPLAPEELESYVRRQLDSLDVEVRSPAGRAYHVAKRLLDLAIAVPALIVALPVMAVIAVLIRRDSPGPALFRQKRVGGGGKVFTFYKFRTMYVDAKERFPELYDYEFASDELAHRYYKQAGDPRNTPIGAFLRRSTLDELPNLINVVKGDISIVGFRPELPELVRHYEPWELAKFNVKAGLACKSECTGRNTNTIRDQITLDLDYVANQSMRLDLWVIFQTLKMVVKGVGAE